MTQTDNTKYEYLRGYQAGKDGKNFSQLSSSIKKKEAFNAFLRGFVEGQATRARGGK